MSAILENVGLVVTESIDWMTAFLSTITKSGNEILLLFVIIPLVGLGVGLLKRLMRI